MSNVTAAQVRAVGGWDSTEVTDTILGLAPYIPAGDGWLNLVLSKNGYANLAALTTADANKGALALGAECYYVAGLYASIPQKDDFKSGPVESKSVKAGDVKISADHLFKKAKEMIGMAGLVYYKWDAAEAGGDDYHPGGDDDTNVDFGLASNADENFNLLGVEDD